MRKYLGVTVGVDGARKHSSDCFRCGRTLDVDDYIFGDGNCSRCRSGMYDSGGKYIDINGTNKIDEILLDKSERSRLK